MPSFSNKTKGLLFILAPFGILIITLFLRVAVSLITVYNAPQIGSGNIGANNPVLEIFTAILNFIALISVLGAIVLTPWGIMILTKKGGGNVVIGNHILAGRWERWLAKFLDGLISFIPALIIAYIAMVASGEDTDTPTSTGLFWLVFLGIGILQAYYLTTQGQTISKRWLKIRIVDVETHQVGGFVKNVLLRSILNAVFCIVPFYSLVDAIFIFREDRRCIHDLLAGTIVVRATGSDKSISKKTASRFCTHCGAKVKPAAKFCVSCGNPVK